MAYNTINADAHHGSKGKRSCNRSSFRDAESLEIMEKVNTLIVDQAVILTEGKPKLVDVIPCNGLNKEKNPFFRCGH